MQLRLDAADRLVELVEERRGPVPAEEAARHLFALAQPPVGLARGLLEETVGADARLVWRGDLVALAAARGAETPLERATFVVVDLETTGLSAASARICEIGAVRVSELELRERFQTLANPGAPLAPAVARPDRDPGRGGAEAPRPSPRRFAGSSRSPATASSSRTTPASTSPSSTARPNG